MSEIKYAEFIKNTISKWRSDYKFPPDDSDIVRGRCIEMSKLLTSNFKELRLVVGFCNAQEHAWCVTSEGTIIDGTGIQFGPVLYYEEYDENNPNHKVKIGRCTECGDNIYGKMTDSPRDICSENCEIARAAYWRMELK